MRLRIILGLFAVLLLYVGWFFISHAYVFMRLTSVLGFMGVVVILLVLVVAFFGRIR